VICYFKHRKVEGGYISEAVDNEGFYEREFYIKEDGGNKLCTVYFFPHCGAVGWL
jgi:hypothetical protein